ncbi:MAG: hypothetical protein IKY44_00375 [Clostridia bacterium]|nr:hypothetical protein [Clostridia bacterium]
MESVKAWAIGICMASLAGTVAHFLAPSGNIQRIFKVVISVFFITVMVYPIVDISLDDVGEVLDGYTDIMECFQRLGDLEVDDVLEVVRCEDCKHWAMHSWCSRLSPFDKVYMGADDYCSKGKRREDG